MKALDVRKVLEVKYVNKSKLPKITKVNVTALLWNAAALDVLAGGIEGDFDELNEILDFLKNIKDIKRRRKICELVLEHFRMIMMGIENTVEHFEAAQEEIEELYDNAEEEIVNQMLKNFNGETLPRDHPIEWK